MIEIYMLLLLLLLLLSTKTDRNDQQYPFKCKGVGALLWTLLKPERVFFIPDWGARAITDLLLFYYCRWTEETLWGECGRPWNWNVVLENLEIFIKVYGIRTISGLSLPVHLKGRGKWGGSICFFSICIKGWKDFEWGSS